MPVAKHCSVFLLPYKWADQRCGLLGHGIQQSYDILMEVMQVSVLFLAAKRYLLQKLKLLEKNYLHTTAAL